MYKYEDFALFPEIDCSDFFIATEREAAAY